MKVLLIDDRASSLAPLNALFKQQLCQTASTKDPVNALKLLKKHHIDVVVCADQLARTSLETLLQAIAIKFPKLIRIAVISTAGTNVDGLAHYVFSQPVEPYDVIITALSFEKNHQQITKDIIVKSVAKVKTLPSPPKVYMQLNKVLKQANVDSDKIADIIAQDPALVAKVLQFTNNTFAKGDKPLTSISDAITKMGVDTLSCIVMTAEMFAYQPNIPNFSLIDEQLHAVATARLAASMVAPELKQDALLAGLLHSIGKLVLFEIDQELTLKYFNNNARTSDDIVLEQRIFSTDHCQVGAYLLHVWCFPYFLIDALLKQYQPQRLLEKQFGLSQALYLANALLRENSVDAAFLAHYQLTEQLDKLKEKALKFKHA